MISIFKKELVLKNHVLKEVSADINFSAANFKNKHYYFIAV